MPKNVIIEVDPEYKPKTAEDKEQLAIAKKLGPKEVDTLTANEAVKNSDGLYRIQAETPEAADIPTMGLADKSNDELKIMMLSLGIKTEKQMRRDGMILLIQKRLDEIEVLDDE